VVDTTSGPPVGVSDERGYVGTWSWPDRLPWGPLGLILLTAVSYAVGSRLALEFIAATGLSSVFFIPAGVMAAFLLRVRVRNWWAIVLPAGAVEALMDLDAGYSRDAVAGYVAANVIGPIVGAVIVKSRCASFDMARLRDFGWFLAGSVTIGTGVAAAIGAGVASVLGEGHFPTQFWQWWLGDALGVILVGSAILVWGPTPDRRPLRSVGGFVLLVGTLVLTVSVLMGTHLPLSFLVLIGVTVAGVLFGPRAVAMAALLIAVAKALHFALGEGSALPGLTEVEALIVIKLRLAVFTLAGFIVAAVVHERERATSDALEARTRAVEAETAHRMEHNIASRLQEGLLPNAPSDLSGLDVAARFAAGTESMMVGGDWFDVALLPDGRIGITLGDVGGHGLDATTQMGRLRTSASTLALYTNAPSELLIRLDNYAQGRHSVEYATVCYSILDPATGLLTYASAGHPPMLVINPSGEVYWLDEATSPPLYGDPADYRPETSIVIEPGSVLIGYTDGLIENLDRDVDVGLRRLEARTREFIDRPIDEICDLLFESLGGDETRRDDVVVLAMRYAPETVLPTHEVSITIER
jgi:serine phosphatase RsbU (regulator of sigma subunit)/integral membrane sensor domain MASE1